MQLMKEDMFIMLIIILFGVQNIEENVLLMKI